MPAATPQLQLKSTYRKTSKLEVFYTGGVARVTRDGKLLACTCSDEVKIVELATGAVVRSFKPDGEAVTALVVSPDCRTLVVATRSLYVRVYNMTTGAQLRSWRAHKAPVADLAIDASGGYVATASADRSVKVWDLAGGFCTHHFNGGHGGVVLRVLFHPKNMQLFSAADDGSVRVWDLVDKSCVHDLKAHFSAVTSLALSPDGWLLLTAGRDQVVVVWDLRSGTKVATVPVYEAVEGLAVLPLGAAYPGLPHRGAVDTAAVLKGAKKQVYFATAGGKGAIKLWRSDTGACVAEVPPEVAVAGSAACELTDLTLLPAAATAAAGSVLGAATGSPGLLAATADARLLFYSPQEVDGARRLVLARQLVGNQDQVTDLRFVGPPTEPSLIAVATNSETVRLYGLSNLSCTTSLVGHRDIVLCLDGGAATGGQPALLASGSKDHEVRLWEAASGRCLGVGVGHVGAVNGVALSRKSHRFLVSVGSDKLIKLWDTTPAVALLSAASGATQADADADTDAYGGSGGSRKKQKTSADGAAGASAEPLQLRTLAAAAGHDKDINAVAVAPNDQFVATASQDRTARVWSLPDLVQVKILRGHKRGVWAVEFAPLERALLTGSGDKTIKLWSLSDQSCLRTFEGHTASVLKATFLTAGTQVLSAGADGLIKLWNVASGECVSTLDQHEDKVWALTTGGGGEGLVATGGGDALVCVWADSTEADAAEATAAEEELAEKEQALQNALADSDFGEAARLAFSLKHPGRLLNIITRAATAAANAANAAIALAVPSAPAASAPSSSASSAGPLGRLLSGLVGAMSDEDLRTAVEYCRDWNTNAKHCHAAQAMLGAIVRTHPPDKLLGISGVSELLAALSAYSIRHFSRLDRLIRSTYLLDFTLESMGVVGLEGVAGDGDGTAGEAAAEDGEAGVLRLEEEDDEGALLARLAAVARAGQKRAREEEEKEEEEGTQESDEEQAAAGRPAAGAGERKGDGAEGMDTDDVSSEEVNTSDSGEGEEGEEGRDAVEEETEEEGPPPGSASGKSAAAVANGHRGPSADDLVDDFEVDDDESDRELGEEQGEEEEEGLRSGKGAEPSSRASLPNGDPPGSDEEAGAGECSDGGEEEDEGAEDGGLGSSDGDGDSQEEGEEQGEEDGDKEDEEVLLAGLRRKGGKAVAGRPQAAAGAGSRGNTPNAGAAAQRCGPSGSKSLTATPLQRPSLASAATAVAAEARRLRRAPATEPPKKGPRARSAGAAPSTPAAEAGGPASSSMGRESARAAKTAPGQGGKASVWESSKELQQLARSLDLPPVHRTPAAAKAGSGGQGNGGVAMAKKQARTEKWTAAASKQQGPKAKPQEKAMMHKPQVRAASAAKAASAPSTPVGAGKVQKGGKGGVPVGLLTGPAKKARKA